MARLKRSSVDPSEAQQRLPAMEAADFGPDRPYQQLWEWSPATSILQEEEEPETSTKGAQYQPLAKRHRSIQDFGDHYSDSDAEETDTLKSPAMFSDRYCVPATPRDVAALEPGACIITPSFCNTHPAASASTSPRQSSASCVAMCEEPNACFRDYMEDRSAFLSDNGICFLGVYDGHGGADASVYLQQHLLKTIHSKLQLGQDIQAIMKQAYLETNSAFKSTGSIQGSTATTVIINSNNNKLICANVGDSPAFVIKKNGEVFGIIQEHKIEGAECQRVASYGVPILRNPYGPTYMGTSDGTRWLNMSRAFGDFVYPAISCDPFVCTLDISDAKYLIIGSDGLTEKWSVAAAAQYVQQLGANKYDLQTICKCLVERSLGKGSTDNVSAVVLDIEMYLQQHQVQQEDSDTSDICAHARVSDDEFVASPSHESNNAEEDEVAL